MKAPIPSAGCLVWIEGVIDDSNFQPELSRIPSEESVQKHFFPKNSRQEGSMPEIVVSESVVDSQSNTGI